MNCELSCGNLATQKHHVSYFPEETIGICDGCHKKIHNNPSKYSKHIKYKKGDSRKFYKQKKLLRKWGVNL